MGKDRQVKRLWRALSSGKRLAQAADKADMDEKTGSIGGQGGFPAIWLQIGAADRLSI